MLSISTWPSDFWSASLSAACASATICSMALVVSATETWLSNDCFISASKLASPAIAPFAQSLAFAKFWSVASVTLCSTSAIVMASATCCWASSFSSADKYVKSAIAVSASFCASANASLSAFFALVTACSTVATSVAWLAWPVYVDWSDSDKLTKLPISVAALSFAFAKFVSVASSTTALTPVASVASEICCL